MAKSTASHSQPWQLFRLKFAKKFCPYCGKVYCLSFPALAIVQIKVCSKCLPMCPYCGKVYNTPSTLPQRWQWSRLIFCGFISCLFQTLNTSTLPLAQSQYCVYTVYNGCILQLRIIIQYKGWIYNYIFLKKVFINSFVFDLGRDNICNCTCTVPKIN